MRRILDIVLLLLLTGAPLAAAGQEGPPFERSEVTVVTGKGRFVFAVDLATTPAQHAWGLTGRTQLSANAGMLFDLGDTRVVSMWMKDAVIALDMLFVDAAGAIVTIEHDAEPHSERLISSQVPVRAILEVNAGTARRLGIDIGDRLIHPLFGEGAP